MDREELRKRLADYLEYLKQSGLDYLPRMVEKTLTPPPADVNPAAIRGTATATIESEKGSAAPGLVEVKKRLGDCRRCRLWKGRKKIVFGTGNPDAELLFVGEAPGRDEDIKGEPFVGRAGQLLTRIIHAIDLRREEVYICNVIKCRPPQNRNPLPEEIEACEPFLVEQIESIRPKVICALGKFAAQTLLKTEAPISTLRGRFHEYHGVPLMPTYHPAYLLRNPKMKRETWEDVQMIQRLLRGEIPNPLL